MRITPLHKILKSKVVKEFLKDKYYQKVVREIFDQDIKEFFIEKYNDYKENGDYWGFENDRMTAELLVYNIECDLE